MKFSIILWIFILPLFSFSQTSVIQNKNGESSLILANNKTVVFNSSDASIGSNFSFNHALGGKEEFWGFSFKVKSNNGISTLLEGNNFKPKFDFGIFKGGSLKSNSSSVSQWYYYSLATNNSYFNLLSSNILNKLDKSSFFGWRAKVGYNKLAAIFKNSTLLGVSLEYGRYNNTDDLKSVDRYEITTDISTIPNTLILSNKKSGFKGNYIEENMIKLNFDYLFYPHFAKNRFAIGGYYRGGFVGKFQKQNLGFGIFLSQDEAPDKIVLGIVYQINDIFDQIKEEPSFNKRTGISITAGYNF